MSAQSPMGSITLTRMYEGFFGLNEKPFAITPDPRYLYLSERHTEALAHLLYGINEAGGFIQLTGEVGTGKTTRASAACWSSCRRHADVALILNPQRHAAPSSCSTICEELRRAGAGRLAGSVKTLDRPAQHYLLDAHAAGRRVVLIVDEAQNLDARRARAGAPAHEPRDRDAEAAADHPDRAAGAARAARSAASCASSRSASPARYHLEALRKDETIAYVRHRTARRRRNARSLHAGAQRELHRLSGGVPRIINVIADRALLGAYTREESIVNGALVRKAASEVYGRPVLAPWIRWLAIGGAIAGARASSASCCGAPFRTFDGPKRRQRQPPQARRTAAKKTPVAAAPPHELARRGARKGMPSATTMDARVRHRSSRSGARSTSRTCRARLRPGGGTRPRLRLAARFASRS